MSYVKVSRALVSVSDKTGIVDFVKGLRELDIEIVSTRGTAQFLEENGISTERIPEMLGGRVKTLYPEIHAAILASRDSRDCMEELESRDIEPIDLLVVNLYSFEKAVEGGCDTEKAIENIDIGGVALLRSAAKNYEDVGVVTDSGDYGKILTELRENESELKEDTRKRLALEAFSLTASYDGAISNYFQDRFSEE